jgi:hypothetical protein
MTSAATTMGALVAAFTRMDPDVLVAATDRHDDVVHQRLSLAHTRATTTTTTRPLANTTSTRNVFRQKCTRKRHHRLGSTVSKRTTSLNCVCIGIGN